MPNEENVDTSGLSFTNCIQNRFFFPSLRHHHHHHVNWHLGWNYGLKMCSQEKSSYESTMLYIFFAKGDSFPFFIAEEEKSKFDTTSALPRLLSTTCVEVLHDQKLRYVFCYIFSLKCTLQWFSSSYLREMLFMHNFFIFRNISCNRHFHYRMWVKGKVEKANLAEHERRKRKKSVRHKKMRAA